jgi:uncharacterized DUF497 family protein
MEFEWDPAKARRNERKHGLPLEEAMPRAAEFIEAAVEQAAPELAREQLIAELNALRAAGV